MRTLLKSIKGQQHQFTATIGRSGWLSPQMRTGSTITLLLLNVGLVSTDKTVAEHLWIKLTKQLASLRLVPGDQITFTATVRAYARGLAKSNELLDRRERDYLVKDLTRVKKL